MYQNGGRLHESANSIRDVKILYKETDTVFSFIEERCQVGAELRIKRDYVYKCYLEHCTDLERQPLSKHKFYSNLRDKSFVEIKIQGIDFFKGLSLADEESESEFAQIKDGDTLPF